MLFSSHPPKQGEQGGHVYTQLAPGWGASKIRNIYTEVRGIIEGICTLFLTQLYLRWPISLDLVFGSCIFHYLPAFSISYRSGEPKEQKRWKDIVLVVPWKNYWSGIWAMTNLFSIQNLVNSFVTSPIINKRKKIETCLMPQACFSLLFRSVHFNA